MAFAHASQKEKPESEKKTHEAVDYQDPSRKKGRFCADCKHFIFATPPRCQGVKSPIDWKAWCSRWEARNG